MPTVSPIIFDESTCQYRAVRNGETLDLLSAEDTNLLDTGADGKVTLDAADLISSIECNVLSVELTDNKLKVCPADLISTVDGGNVIGVNPDDHKLYINPCLIPGPQNIVSTREGNLIQKDPDDCSAYLSAPGLTDELFSFADERNYFGPGLVYTENQDGSHQLRVASCSGLTVEDATFTDGAGNVHNVKALAVNLDPASPLLHFAPNADQCQDCLSTCDTLALTMRLNANGSKLRVLDKDGDVYTSINIGNGLQGDGSGGLTINTLDAMGDGTSDLPVSAKALKTIADPEGSGGLYYNPQTNTWEVDFTKNQQALEELLKALRLPIWLTRNLNVYVALTGVDDSSEEGRGLSAELPFRTLQYALNYVAENYNLNSHDVNIYVAAGDYFNDGSINFPAYTTGTGLINVRGASTEDPRATRLGRASFLRPNAYGIYNVTFCIPDKFNGESSALSCSGGSVDLYNVGFDRSNADVSAGCYFISCINSGRVGISARSMTDPTGAIFYLREHSPNMKSMIYVGSNSTIRFSADMFIKRAQGVAQTVTTFDFMYNTVPVFDLRDMGLIVFGRTSATNPGRTPIIDTETGMTLVGKKYNATTNSIMNAASISADDIPCNTAGTTTTGAQVILAS